ncbi:MAG: glycosyltransferase family 4 protein [Gemmatimonadetes bacterium]|nr:glycosyltransferase family 4 protein [Gemmatimonadota bacterium]
MRILHLDSGRHWRGGQRQVFLLAAAQRERGLEPLVVAAPLSPLAGRLKTQGIASAAAAMRADFDVVAMRRVRRIVSRWRPDVVHAHDARAHAIALGALVGTDVPLVVTRRVPFVPKGRLKYGPRVAHFIAISHAVADAMARGGVSTDRVTVVYSGVPTPDVGHPRDWRLEAGWPRQTLLCGVVGAMTAEKGIALLQDIGRHIAPAARDRLRLVLLGGAAVGADEFGGIAAFRAGFVDAIHNAMAGLDMLWHPSGAEGLGTAVIDAMALGVPPVSFATGGLVELIEHGRSGLLAPPGDARAFAREVSQLALDDALRRTLAAGGRVRAGQFGVDRMVNGTAAVYERVLASRSGAAAGASSSGRR